jgi:ParB/RepB/Spo0J family partition protein
MTSKTKIITISKLLPHPDNPNVMSEAKFNKLVRNIGRTGLYEPVVVRPHPKKKDYFQIINGHHRVKALEKIGKSEADCVVWDVDDEQTAILLTTLNRLTGSDVLAKKVELLKELKKRFNSAELAKILPNTKKQIEQLTNLKNSVQRTGASVQCVEFAIPLVFFVTKRQQEIIENALEKAAFSVQRSADGLTKAQKRARALTEITGYFMREKLCRTSDGSQKSSEK